MHEHGRILWAAIAASAFVVAALAVGAVIWSAQKPPVGPQRVIWDKESCAECQMAVSEHGFAAQLQTQDGQIFDFDDPGCLAAYLLKAALPVRALYFHHLREDRWIPVEKVAFIPASPSPMAYDLGAVDQGTPGSIPWQEAQSKFLGRSSGGGEK